jgi:flagellar biosynthesis/type III secretory pathway M-ring protein FliF/YscJ
MGNWIWVVITIVVCFAMVIGVAILTRDKDTSDSNEQEDSNGKEDDEETLGNIFEIIDDNVSDKIRASRLKENMKKVFNEKQPGDTVELVISKDKEGIDKERIDVTNLPKKLKKGEPIL